MDACAQANVILVHWAAWMSLPDLFQHVCRNLWLAYSASGNEPTHCLCVRLPCAVGAWAVLNHLESLRKTPAHDVCRFLDFVVAKQVVVRLLEFYKLG